jgi:hypothetical protein
LNLLTNDNVQLPNNHQGIIKAIMELWRHYQFVRYVKKYPKRMSVEYTQVLNDYRAKLRLDENEIDDLWNDAVDKDYLEVYNGGCMRLRAKGKELVELGLYGFINALLKQHGAPILWLAGVASIVNLLIVWAQTGWKL